MKKILLIFGTRPEAIKMAPLVHQFLKYKSDFKTKICLTGQHLEMLNQLLDFFNIEADYNLNVMKTNNNLHVLTSDIIKGVKDIIEDFNPHYVFVHGERQLHLVAV